MRLNCWMSCRTSKLGVKSLVSNTSSVQGDFWGVFRSIQSWMSWCSYVIPSDATTGSVMMSYTTHSWSSGQHFRCVFRQSLSAECNEHGHTHGSVGVHTRLRGQVQISIQACLLAAVTLMPSCIMVIMAPSCFFFTSLCCGPDSARPTSSFCLF